MSADVVTDRRDRILRAASRHFASNHYDKVSTVAIANEAGVNRGWLYHEFGSKRDLYLAVMNRTVRTPTLPSLSGLVASDDLGAAVDKVVARWLDEVDSHRESYLALLRVHTGSHRDPVIRGVLREMHEGTIDSVLATATSDPAAAPPAARALVACYGELAYQALWEWLEAGRLDRTQVQTVLSHALVSLIEMVPEVVG